MKTIKTMLLLTVATLLVGLAAAQPINDKAKADYLYASYAYAQAIPLYKAVLKHDSTSVEVLHRIASCYRLTGNAAQAAKYYGLLHKKGNLSNNEPLCYAQTLLLLGNIAEANKVMVSYQLAAEAPQPSLTYASATSYGDFIGALKLTVTNLERANTPNSEIGATFFDAGILYSTNTYFNDYLSNNHAWTNKDFYNISLLTPCGDVVNTPELNSKYNNAPAFYCPANRKLYVTQNVTSPRTLAHQPGRQASLRVEVFAFNEAKNRWDKAEPFPFNNPAFSVGHVAVSPSGNTLVFSSNKPGGRGGMDLYIATRHGGSWSDPVNAGPAVNTPGNETFPAFFDNSTLFYSTDGIPLMGGMDIYYTHLDGMQCTVPTPMAYPISSSSDDFGIQFAADNRSALFVSNRPGGVGDDDIYQVDIIHPAIPDKVIAGLIVDKVTKLPLAHARIALYDFSDNLLDSVTSDDGGRFSATVPEPISIQFEGRYPDYFANRSTASLGGEGAYHVLVELLPKINVSVYGLVVDRNTAQKLDSVKVRLVDNSTKRPIFTALTDESGSFLRHIGAFAGEVRLDLGISLERRGYYPKYLDLAYIITRSGQINLTEKMDLGMEPLTAGRRSMDSMLKPIHFDFNRWAIRPDAAAELNKIVALVKADPSLRIDIESYTDCRGSDLYNLELSKKRAQATVGYLVQKGVPSAVLTYKWYGKGKPAVSCLCERGAKASCTSRDHAQNRRTEFYIIKP